MAEREPRRDDRQHREPTVDRARRRRRLAKPAGWPRYMIAKRRSSGIVAYYWNARGHDILAGFKLHRAQLGTDYTEAIKRAKPLNGYLDAWRQGRGAEKSLDIGPRHGTVDWWLESDMRSPAFDKLKERTRPTYRCQLRSPRALVLPSGYRLVERKCSKPITWTVFPIPKHRKTV